MAAAIALPARSQSPLLTLVPAAIVISAVVFNAALALVNAQVRPLGSGAVIGAELMLVAAAHGVALLHFRRAMAPWYVLIAILVLIAVVRTLATAEIELKYLRDVLILPTFIVLGMTFDPRRLTPTVIVLHAFVLAVMLFEWLAPAQYADLFKVQDYYVATRGYDVSQFWSAGSDLFVSAERPGQRLFSFIDLHRLSSVFLEPVSFGNYCIVIVAYAFAAGSDMGRGSWWFLILGAAAGIVATDGRLAAASSVIIAGLSWLAPRLPRRSAIIYVPAVTITTILATHALSLTPGTDDLAGRVANTVKLLSEYDLVEYLGLSNRYIAMAVDSGLGYLIVTQSLIGVALLYAFIVCFTGEDTRPQVRFVHSVCVYLAFALLVSYAFLSIKTAALLWFVYGTLNARSAAPSFSPAAWSQREAVNLMTLSR